ncbi:MAG: fasciclin domain-containing protein [Thainema sp.]
MKRLATTAVTKKILAGILTLGTVVTVSACASEQDTVTTAPTTEDPAAVDDANTAEEPMASDMETDAAANGSIVEVASSAGSFNTLTQAIEAAGLTETLSQDGSSYTVFAPTDEAFNQLPEGTLDQLLLPENQELLRQILTYHVVPQAVTSSEIQPGEVSTVEGSPVNLQVDGSSVMVNEAMVTQPDIEASNGVIHAIDQVILPPQIAAQLTGAGAGSEG